MSRNPSWRPAKESIRSASRATPRNLQVPIEDGNYGMLLMFRDYQYQLPGTRGFASTESSNITDTIFLPLPENIADNFEVRVQRFDQGTGGAIISDVMSRAGANGMNISSLQESAIQAVIQSLPSALTSGDEAFNALSQTLTSILGGEGDLSSLDRFSGDAAFLLRKILPGNVGRSVDAGTGTFVNPKAALSFEGVEMKTHNFNWTIAPKSEPESDNLRNVIRTINRNILPQYVENSELFARAMFKYPSMVDVFFVGLDSDFYYYFKTAMVRTFNVNYTPNGVSVLRGGRPAAVQMQMAIIESDIHTSEDYGGSSFSFGSTNNPPSGTPTVQ